jgi:hypothetical protein
MEETNPIPSYRFSSSLGVIFLKFATWGKITYNGAFFPQELHKIPQSLNAGDISSCPHKQCSNDSG